MRFMNPSIKTSLNFAAIHKTAYFIVSSWSTLVFHCALSYELSMTCLSHGPVSPIVPPSQSDLEHVLHLCYIFVTLYTFVLLSQVRGSDRIISQDVITSSSKQNECSSEEWFENTVLMYNSNDCDYHQQKLWLSSLSNFVFKNILFSSLNLILSDEKSSNECSHFCWRQLGSET